MKEYDIYLKSRIHDAKIYIQSLTYREGLSVTNRIILDAMLRYFALQKQIATDGANIALAAQIDDVLAAIYEVVGNDMSLNADAALLTHHYVQPQELDVEVAAGEAEPLVQSFFSVANALEMQIENSDARVLRVLSGTENAIEFALSEPETHKQGFLEIPNVLLVNATVGDTFEQSYEAVESAMALGLPELGLYWCFAIGFDTILNLAASITDIDVHFSLGEAGSSVVIEQSAPETRIEKRLRISNEIYAFCALAAKMTAYFGAEAGTVIQAVGAADLKRHRLLEELDDLTLGDIDTMTLGELDYVTLT